MTDASSQTDGYKIEVSHAVAVVTLDRPDRKNPLTFHSYGRLRDWFTDLRSETQIRAVVVTGAGNNFCSGGDVHEIIGPLVRREVDHLSFTRMTGDLVKAMRAAPQPIIAAVDGIAAGAGAILAMASDLRIGTPTTRTAFLFSRVGLAGADMGACAILPRLIGHGRAAELLFTGREMSAAEGLDWGFYTELVEREQLADRAFALAVAIAQGPFYAHQVTKRMLHLEWSMSIDDAIDAEAIAQALCMGTSDFGRAYEAFANRRTPEFEGN